VCDAEFLPINNWLKGLCNEERMKVVAIRAIACQSTDGCGKDLTSDVEFNQLAE
jgi:hypothetical protein